MQFKLPFNSWKFWSFTALFSLVFLFSFQLKKKTVSHFVPAFLNEGEVWAKEQIQKMSLAEKVNQLFLYQVTESNDTLEFNQLLKNNKLGGFVFYGGTKERIKSLISKVQKNAKTPYFIGLDAEWGTAMRISDEVRFPYPYTLGAANDTRLTEQVAEMIASECREMGIHFSFSPVADVNTNAQNEAIGFRSFGDQSVLVSKHVEAMVKGIESQGVFSTLKHFPGHGSTREDSHVALPEVSISKENLLGDVFAPFRVGIQSGTSSVMLGHISVPALDSSGTPASLSQRIVQNYLKKELEFKGLVICDALNMKALKDSKSNLIFQAFKAGSDLFIVNDLNSENIADFLQLVEKNPALQKEVEARCTKILMAKFHVLFPKSEFKQFTLGEKEWVKNQVYEKATCLVENKGKLLPFNASISKIALVSIGENNYAFKSRLKEMLDIDVYQFENFEEAKEKIKSKLSSYNTIITSIHCSSLLAKKNFGMPKKYNEWLTFIPTEKNHLLVQFGNPYALADLSNDNNLDGLILAYENSNLVQDRVAQQIMGAIPFQGKLTTQFSSYLTQGKGHKTEALDRLKFSQIEELYLDPAYFEKIDQLLQKSIADGVFPGCQVAIAIEGKLIYQKSFGKQRYEGEDTIRNSDLYDIASVTKIASSTLALMRLQTLGKFSLDKKLKEYIPEVTKGGKFGEIKLRDMMAHQAGLVAWIPFYKKTLLNGKPNPAFYSTVKKEGYETQVASDLWISDSYADSIYEQILSSTLSTKKSYLYSDLGYYFAKKIIEKESQMPLNNFVENIYRQMGLQRICYSPLNQFKATEIVPTENDQAFRKQLVSGYVHDPGAAMLGGVGGHAGLFANAGSLAALMQMYLNGGSYGGVTFIQKSVVQEYTKAQNPGNRRGAGFDRPTNSGGPCNEKASQSSFGHSGFTGTFVWADPKYNINYVFLSNRVYPDADNWKITQTGIRTKIQGIIYDAVLDAKKKQK